jgi:putative peptidoglycan lipid II flippase
MLLNIVFSLLFSALFARAGWAPHGGLALANSLATALEMLALLALMRRRLKGLELAGLARALGAAGLAALGMGLSVWAWLQFSAAQVGSRLSGPVVQVAGGLLLGGLVYGVLLVALRVKEVQTGLGFLRRRLSKN